MVYKPPVALGPLTKLPRGEVRVTGMGSCRCYGLLLEYYVETGTKRKGVELCFVGSPWQGTSRNKRMQWVVFWIFLFYINMWLRYNKSYFV